MVVYLVGRIKTECAVIPGSPKCAAGTTVDARDPLGAADFGSSTIRIKATSVLRNLKLGTLARCVRLFSLASR
ncbi:hypothetical protein [Bradyrhizobium guangxiense]|uniref:hypothetical protein n=1 Tax=Bradyrhizobium guangxiense TaxID=1325115 RepID=UPI001008F9A0|nr:hypothetical protein [Bradyrhizobium guangxiense]